MLSIYPDGRSQKIWMHPDGSWDGQSRRGTPLAGRWSVKDGKVCMKQSKPPTLPLAYCTAFPENTYVGVTWTSKDMAGAPIQLKVVKAWLTPRPENSGRGLTFPPGGRVKMNAQGNRLYRAGLCRGPRQGAEGRAAGRLQERRGSAAQGRAAGPASGGRRGVRGLGRHQAGDYDENPKILFRSGQLPHPFAE